jgi:anti-anti-sigma regulatory factor
MRRMVASATQDILIIDLLDVPHMDGSAALALEQIVHRAIDGGQDVIIVGLSFAVARLCGSLGVLDLIKETERLATRGEALLAARARLAARDLRVQSGAVAS